MEKIAATRNDPLLNAANFVERLDVDAAREWHMDYKESDKCTEMRIRLNMVDSQHDKRYVGRAEALMRYIEERAKVLMLDTRLAIEEWEMAVD